MASATNWVQVNEELLGRHEHYSKFDAQIKYAYIISRVMELELASTNAPVVIEIGAGDGHLARSVSRLLKLKVLAVDIQRRRFILERPRRPLQELQYLFLGAARRKRFRVTALRIGSKCMH